MRVKVLAVGLLLSGCTYSNCSSDMTSIPAKPGNHDAELPSQEVVSDPISNLRAQRDEILKSGDKIVVVVSFFDNGRLSVPQHVYVFTDGQRGMIRILEYATQGGGESAPTKASIPDSDRIALKLSISRLPPSQKYASDANVFLVSWKENGKWVSRTYDRTKLSPEVLDFCDLVNIPRTWL